MDALKKKTFWYALIALLVFFTDIWVYFYLKESNAPFLPSESRRESALEKTSEENLIDPAMNIAAKAPASVTRLLSDDPAKDFETLKEQALRLTSPEIQKLAQDAVNPQNNQDKRFASIYTLSLNGQATDILKKIVESPFPKNPSPQDRDFEHILRAQAIEGIENGLEKKLSLQMIQDLIIKTDNVFLLDRLERAKNSLEGRTGSSEVQDNNQLEKIIGN